MKSYNGYIIIEKDYEKIISKIEYKKYIIGKGKKSYAINFVPCGFDIETSTIYKKEPDKKGSEKVTQHFSFMYIWQLSFGDYIFIGRTWEEFESVINAIETHLCKAKNKFLMFIQNSDFEFQFFSKQFEKMGHTINIFARTKRKPLKIEIDEKIIILDSYKLTGYSLAKIGENYCTTKKLVGDLDYNLVRLPITKLTENELSYCYNDVIILKEYALYYEENYLMESFVPMTKTMIANRVVKKKIKEMKCSKDVRCLMQALYPKTKEEYEYIMLFYTGAYTHGYLPNLFTTHYDCLSFDVTSEYPYCMLNGYYPMGKFTTLSKRFYNNIDYYLSNFCCLCDVTLTNIKSKCAITLISQNKCTDVINPIWDNGRLYKADSVRVWITEVDIETYRKIYNFDIEYNNVTYCKRGKLPIYFRLAICELYAKKCILKGVEGKEVEYLQSKSDLNGMYGACCTKVVFTELYFDNGWKEREKEIDFEEFGLFKDKLPQWAIYITAHARNLILSQVTKITNVNHNDYIYTDTDSIKCKYKDYIIKLFEETNNKIKSDNMIWIDELNLKERYPDVDFSELGTFDREKDMIRFKSLGSKRYIYETVDNELHQTIAGLPKGKFFEYCENVSRETSTEIDPFDLFNETGVILSDSDSGKLTAFYNDNMEYMHVTDYLGNEMDIVSESYVSIIPIQFSMGKTKSFVELYNLFKQEKENYFNAS